MDVNVLHIISVTEAEGLFFSSHINNILENCFDDFLHVLQV